MSDRGSRGRMLSMMSSIGMDVNRDMISSDLLIHSRHCVVGNKEFGAK